jgi:hypothetical protein
VRNWILIILIALLTTALPALVLAGNTPAEIAQRCAPPTKQEKPLYSSDFHWGYDISEMVQKSDEMYNSDKRLPKRAYWDVKRRQLILPYTKERGGNVVVTEDFVQTIAAHVERAFANSFIDAVFFPDMGHSHLLIPQQRFDEYYAKIPNEKVAKIYQEVFRDPELKILYHTAEQLKMLDDDKNVLPNPWLRWRHHSRNIVGVNSLTKALDILQNPESKANTVGEVPGYYWWGAGFNLSANKKGCFEFKRQGQSYYFDLSLFDLEADPSAPQQAEAP